MSDKLPRMDYRQHRRARRLVHECCNYDEGNCLLLDDGEPCVCVQSISLSLMCRWFRVAVLPLDGELAAALLYRGSRKRCAVCGAAFVPKSNRGKYCPDCAGRMMYGACLCCWNATSMLEGTFPYPYINIKQIQWFKQLDVNKRQHKACAKPDYRRQ